MTWSIKTSDTFNRADGALPGSTLDNGAGGTETNTWTEYGTTGWVVSSNTAIRSGGTGTTVAVASTAATTSQRVTGTLVLPGGGNAALRAFFDPATGKSYFLYNGSSLGIYYFDGGAFNPVNTGTRQAGGVVISLECTPNAQVAYVGGVSTLTGTDANLSSGIPAMYTEGLYGFDNFTYEVTAAVPVATQLVITTAPVGNQSGVAFPTQPVVAVRDVSNTTVTTDTSTVSVALITVSGSGTLSGTTTKAAVAGVADFAGLGLKVTGTGSFKLRFTDGSLTLADSATFYVGAAELTFTGTLPTQCYTQYVLTPSLTVAVQDGGGTTVGNSTASVTLALTQVSKTSQIELGTFTKSAVAGVATFDDLTFKGEDGASVRLTASSGGLAQASMTFTLNLRSLRVTFTGT